MSRTGLAIARFTDFSRRRDPASLRCSFCSAGGIRKRRRGKLPLASTKKERIRSLRKKPESRLEMPSIDLQKIDFNKVGDAVESRLTQAQAFVYKFWRPEGPRPERSKLNMDDRWWFWNILLMSVPGICIALYCEFKAKPEMHELLAKLDEEQRARILGETFEAEEEVFEMSEQDVKRLKNSVNAEISDGDGDENLTLLALKQRLDALESQLLKKDKKLDHVRRYQLERTQQSGVQNRIEDKMIAEWKSQGKVQQSKGVKESSDGLSERMKEAIIHGFGENLDAKKEAIRSYSEKGLEYGRRLFSGEQKEPGEPPSSEPAKADTRDDNKTRSIDEEVVKSVSDAVSHANRAAEIVSDSISLNDSNEMARAAKEASEATAKAAQAAADAASQTQSKSAGSFLSRQWNKLFRRGDIEK